MKRVLLLLLLLGIIVPIPLTSGSTTQPTELEIEVHQLINNVRADEESHGQDLRQLELHSVLIDVARSHSQDMLERDYFAHVNPEGEGPSDRVSDAGVEWNRVGENLVYLPNTLEKNVAEEAVEGWVNSPGHYQNIITDFAFTGIGVASSSDTYYITQVFVNADPNHLDEIGKIYQNDELENLQSTEDEEPFRITTNMAIIGVIVFFVILGIDAGRRNDRYYGRRR